MIDGVKIVPLRQVVDERGKIMHMLKATDPHFIKFGEIYFSCAWPGTVKAWHIHAFADIVLIGQGQMLGRGDVADQVRAVAGRLAAPMAARDMVVAGPESRAAVRARNRARCRSSVFRA